MQDKEFDKIIQNSLSDKSSSSKISEEAMWNKISESINSRSKISFFSFKAFIVYFSIAVLISLLVFINIHNHKTEVITKNNTPLLKKNEVQVKNHIVDTCNKVNDTMIKQKTEKQVNKQSSKQSNQNNQIKTINSLPEQQIINDGVEKENVIQNIPIEEKQTIVQPQIVTKQIQITDTILKTKRIRRK